MTKTYALQRLLEHGSLTFAEIREITFWTPAQSWSAISCLIQRNAVMASGRRGKTVYELAS